MCPFLPPPFSLSLSFSSSHSLLVPSPSHPFRSFVNSLFIPVFAEATLLQSRVHWYPCDAFSSLLLLSSSFSLFLPFSFLFLLFSFSFICWRSNEVLHDGHQVCCTYLHLGNGKEYEPSDCFLFQQNIKISSKTQKKKRIKILFDISHTAMRERKKLSSIIKNTKIYQVSNPIKGR